MKVISKFIINRNDEEYYYAEKIKDNNGIKYLVYLKSKKILAFNQHNFHDIYGVDEKLSISNFAYQASLKLISGYTYNENQKEGYDRLRKVLEKTTQDKNPKNPNLGINKTDLLNGIDIYNNELVSLNSLEYVDIPYIENYNLIMSLKKESEEVAIPIAQKTNDINREYEPNREIYHEEKELVRNRKYDN